MFAQNVRKGINYSRGKQDKKVSEYLKNRIRFNSDQMYALCPIKCSCSEFPNGKPKRSRRLDDAGLNHLSYKKRTMDSSLICKLTDRVKELGVGVLTGFCFESLENWNEDVEVGALLAQNSESMGEEGLSPSQLWLPRAGLPRYRRPRDPSRDVSS